MQSESAYCAILSYTITITIFFFGTWIISRHHEFVFRRSWWWFPQCIFNFQPLLPGMLLVLYPYCILPIVSWSFLLSLYLKLLTPYHCPCYAVIFVACHFFCLSCFICDIPYYRPYVAYCYLLFDLSLFLADVLATMSRIIIEEVRFHICTLA